MSGPHILEGWNGDIPVAAVGDVVVNPSWNAAEEPAQHQPRHPSGITPILHNVVATVNLDCQIDLKTVALKARNAEYNPKRFAATIMRLQEPKTTALIFHSGKMVCTGAKSEALARVATRKFAKILQKLGFPTQFKEFQVQNMTGCCDLGFPIRLEGLAFAHSQFCQYEPEIFPGLNFRMLSPKVVLLIFVSGKIVLTGAKDFGQLYQAFENIYPVLCNFKKVVVEKSIPTSENEEEG